MKRVLIASNEDDRICEIVNPGDVEVPVSPPLFWADAPNNVGFDWLWNNGNPQPPPPPLPPSAAELATAARKLAFDDILEELVDSPQYQNRPLVAAYRSHPGRPPRGGQ